MPRLAWITDPHLNFVDAPGRDAFYDAVRDAGADAVLVGGDIGEAHDFALHLARMCDRVGRPVYFVLGNHDYYRSSIAKVRGLAEKIGAVDGLVWLPAAGVVPLSPQTALIGHGGWADARFGDFDRSTVMLNDYALIAELSFLSPHERKRRLHALGDEAGLFVRRILPAALASHGHVVLLTHVPPFREAAWHEGHISNDQWLPHMSCKAMGEAILEVMAAHPDQRLTVLCGHTHGEGETRPAANVHAVTGGAVYGKPAVQRVVEVE
jgi:predicted phosphohydrolase